MSENILDAENWRLEAAAVINDVKNHVEYIDLSSVLKSSDQHIYLNVKTKELNNYCIELSALGFRIVANKFDERSENNDEWFETPYSLLNKISPLFNKSFGNELLNKLTQLQE